MHFLKLIEYISTLFGKKKNRECLVIKPITHSKNDQKYILFESIGLINKCSRFFFLASRIRKIINIYYTHIFQKSGCKEVDSINFRAKSSTTELAKKVI